MIDLLLLEWSLLSCSCFFFCLVFSPAGDRCVWNRGTEDEGRCRWLDCLDRPWTEEPPEGGADWRTNTHTHTHALLNNTKRLHRAGEELWKGKCFLTTCSWPGGGRGTRDSLAENSLIVSSKSACLAGRSWTRRLGEGMRKKEEKFNSVH